MLKVNLSLRVCKFTCSADLWDVVLKELRVWFSINNGRGGEQGAVVNRGRTQLPTGTARDDACRLSCQVNGTWKGMNSLERQGICHVSAFTMNRNSNWDKHVKVHLSKYLTPATKLSNNLSIKESRGECSWMSFTPAQKSTCSKPY